MGGGNVGSRPLRTRSVVAGLVAICAGSALGTASPAVAGGPLELFVSPRLEAYGNTTLRAEGFANSPLELWVYEDPEGNACAVTAAERKPETQLVIAGLPVDGAFSQQRLRKLRKAGRRSYCAYLGPDVATVEDTSFQYREVVPPLLRARRANRMVAAALRRHDFAQRVVENLEQRCRRRSRSRFSCRFSSAFPGYSLSGRGSVELKSDISYRFRVRVQGRTLVLTDENEGGFPG